MGEGIRRLGAGLVGEMAGLASVVWIPAFAGMTVG